MEDLRLDISVVIMIYTTIVEAGTLISQLISLRDLGHYRQCICARLHPISMYDLYMC